MADKEWGLCKECKWWQIEPSVKTTSKTMGLCIEEKLQRFLLRVSPTSGCDRFIEGEPARAKGSSKAPPTAKPSR